MENSCFFLVICAYLLSNSFSHAYPSSSKEVSGSGSGEKLGLIDSDVDLVKIETEFLSTIIPAPTNSPFNQNDDGQFTEVTDDGLTTETIIPTQDSPGTTDGQSLTTAGVTGQVDSNPPKIETEDPGELPSASNPAPVQVDLDEVAQVRFSEAEHPEDPSSLLSTDLESADSVDPVTAAVPAATDGDHSVTSPGETSETHPPQNGDKGLTTEEETPGSSGKVERDSVEQGHTKGETEESGKKSDIIEKHEDHKPQFEDTHVNNKTGNANSDAEVVPGQELIKHGATYYIQNVQENVVLTSHKHKFLPIGLLPGDVTTEEFARESSQTWDAILGKSGPEVVDPEESIGGHSNRDSTFWLSPLSYSLNTVTVVRDTSGSPFPLRNFFHIVPTQSGDHKGAFLLRSAPLQKCIQNEGKHRPIVYAACDPTLPSQQWTAEFLYEDRKALTL